MTSAAYTCQLRRGEQIIYTSYDRGIQPLLTLLREGPDVSGCDAEDKIVGKAAALLYVYMKVRAVHAEVMSQTAGQILQAHGIRAEASTWVEHIINRRGDGLCPMEQTVADIQDPAAAVPALEATLQRLRAQKP